METGVYTNLDRLNDLLRNTDIPAFRKTVSSSMNNIKWLRSTLLKDSGLNTELRELLQLDPKTLLKKSNESTSLKA